MTPRLSFQLANKIRGQSGAIEGWRRVTELGEELAKERRKVKRLQAQLRRLRMSAHEAE